MRYTLYRLLRNIIPGMAESREEPDQYGSMTLDPPDGPEYSASGRGSEVIEEGDSIMEESESDTIGRSAIEDDGENESVEVDGWSEDAKNAHKKEFWTKIGESLDIPWREAEAMHFELGEEELSSRAGETPQHPTVNDMIADVRKGIDHLSGLLHLVTEEPHEELTYSRLLHALARAPEGLKTLPRWTWRLNATLVPGVVNFTMTEGDNDYVLVPETTRMTLEIRKSYLTPASSNKPTPKVRRFLGRSKMGDQESGLLGPNRKETVIFRSDLKEVDRLDIATDLVEYSRGNTIKQAVFKYTLIQTRVENVWRELHILKALRGNKRYVPFDRIVLDEVTHNILGLTTGYIAGGTLEHYRGTFYFRWLKQLTDAVDELNFRYGLMHQDLAPRNILIDPASQELLDLISTDQHG
ncbi:hypothetical protein A7C99_2944 [Trichophyton rubrum]|uniref:EKC/KEOPS complex subunit BUD32 n=4 Tax=Trichophyton TaxID=5550 RepID=A0A178F2H7_TRIRU|nr:hypothetical protein A7C99_2944 [Trichophyton rubrum]